MIRQQMTAISASQPGGPENLQIEQIGVPHPQAGEYLVKVAFAGVNRPDILQRQGLYPPPEGAPLTLGLEIAGEVVASGEDTMRFAAGDKVCALVNGGGYGDYCLSREEATLPVPEGLDLLQAAALPETFFTVWHNVFERGRLKRGETLLVHGGSSGIGTTAIQLGHAFGATILTTAGSPEKCSAVEKLGATRAIHYLTEDFVSIVKKETGGRGADVILDMVGGDYIERNFKAAAADGRIVQIAFLKGARVEVNFMSLMLKRLTLTGSTLRTRSAQVKQAIGAALEEKVWPLLASGEVRPVIDTVYPLREAANAHRHMESSHHIGKIMLEVSSADAT